jgi:hypothetical protein
MNYPVAICDGIKNTDPGARITTSQNDRLNGILKNDDIIINPVPVGLKSGRPEPQDPDLPGLILYFPKSYKHDNQSIEPAHKLKIVRLEVTIM